jgi:hypothetical protein
MIDYIKYMSTTIKLWKHQEEAIKSSEHHRKCLINIWCECEKTWVI